MKYFSQGDRLKVAPIHKDLIIQYLRLSVPRVLAT